MTSGMSPAGQSQLFAEFDSVDRWGPASGHRRPQHQSMRRWPGVISDPLEPGRAEAQTRSAPHGCARSTPNRLAAFCGRSDSRFPNHDSPLNRFPLSFNMLAMCAGVVAWNPFTAQHPLSLSCQLILTLMGIPRAVKLLRQFTAMAASVFWFGRVRDFRFGLIRVLVR